MKSCGISRVPYMISFDPLKTRMADISINKPANISILIKIWMINTINDHSDYHIYTSKRNNILMII